MYWECLHLSETNFVGPVDRGVGQFKIVSGALRPALGQDGGQTINNNVMKILWMC